MDEAFWEQQWDDIRRDLSRIEAELRKTNPQLKWQARQWPSAVYPLATYGSAIIGRPEDEIESVDLSLQFRWEGERLLATSDICLSNGHYVADGPGGLEPDDIDRATWVKEQIASALNFFWSELDTLRDLVKVAE